MPASPQKPDLPVVLVKWYDYAKWVLERGPTAAGNITQAQFAKAA